MQSTALRNVHELHPLNVPVHVSVLLLCSKGKRLSALPNCENLIRHVTDSSKECSCLVTWRNFD